MELQTELTWLYSQFSLASLTRAGTVARSIAEKVLSVLGDPSQYVKLLKRRKTVDLVYAADQQSATGLLILRKLGLFRKPIIVVIHNGPRLKWTWWALRSASAVIAISPPTKNLCESRIPNVKSVLLDWGPSVGSPVYSEVIKEKRDLDFISGWSIQSRLFFAAPGR